MESLETSNRNFNAYIPQKRSNTCLMTKNHWQNIVAWFEIWQFIVPCACQVSAKLNTKWKLKMNNSLYLFLFWKQCNAYLGIWNRQNALINASKSQPYSSHNLGKLNSNQVQYSIDEDKCQNQMEWINGTLEGHYWMGLQLALVCTILKDFLCVSSENANRKSQISTIRYLVHVLILSTLIGRYPIFAGLSQLPQN